MRWELTGEDFDAFAEERARATAMSAPRAAVKRRLVAWMRDVADRLAEEGVDLETAASDEHPSARNGHRVDAQAAFLFRAELPPRVTADEAQPELGHARVEVRVDASGASLVLRLGGDARADLEHAAAMLPLEPEEVVSAWEAMPEGALVEARGSLSPRAKKFDELGPRELAQIAREALESDVPLVIGLRATREEAEALAGWPEMAIALGRMLDALAWSADAAAWVAARLAERPSRRGKKLVPRVAPSPPPAEAAPKPVIDRGVHVRALAGPFAGQAGVVQELDGKGGARVLFGLLSSRVELRDLAVKGKERGRPVLSSSHRKPST